VNWFTCREARTTRSRLPTSGPAPSTRASAPVAQVLDGGHFFLRGNANRLPSTMFTGLPATAAVGT